MLQYQKLARRFGVSRTHVRMLIRQAESEGLIRVVRDDG